jgi:hypothetical protein
MVIKCCRSAVGLPMAFRKLWFVDCWRKLYRCVLLYMLLLLRILCSRLEPWYDVNNYECPSTISLDVLRSFETLSCHARYWEGLPPVTRHRWTQYSKLSNTYWRPNYLKDLWRTTSQSFKSSIFFSCVSYRNERRMQWVGKLSEPRDALFIHVYVESRRNS